MKDLRNIYQDITDIRKYVLDNFNQDERKDLLNFINSASYDVYCWALRNDKDAVRSLEVVESQSRDYKREGDVLQVCLPQILRFLVKYANAVVKYADSKRYLTTYSDTEDAVFKDKIKEFVAILCTKDEKVLKAATEADDWVKYVSKKYGPLVFYEKL